MSQINYNRGSRMTAETIGINQLNPETPLTPRLLQEVASRALRSMAVKLGLSNSEASTSIMFAKSDDEPTEPPIEQVRGISQQEADEMNRNQTIGEAQNPEAVRQAENIAFLKAKRKDKGALDIRGRKKRGK